MGWGLALVGGRTVRFCAGLIGRKGSRGTGSQWVGIDAVEFSLRGRRLIVVVGRQGWQIVGAQACVCAAALITVVLRGIGEAYV